VERAHTVCAGSRFYRSARCTSRHSTRNASGLGTPGSQHFLAVFAKHDVAGAEPGLAGQHIDLYGVEIVKPHRVLVNGLQPTLDNDPPIGDAIAPGNEGHHLPEEHAKAQRDAGGGHAPANQVPGIPAEAQTGQSAHGASRASRADGRPNHSHRRFVILESCHVPIIPVRPRSVNGPTRLATGMAPGASSAYAAVQPRNTQTRPGSPGRACAMIW